MLASLVSLLTAAAIPLAAYGLGCPIVRASGVVGKDRLARGVWSVAVGLVIAGTGLAGLGLVDGLYPPLIGIATMAACAWALGYLLLEPANERELREAHGATTEDPVGLSESAPWSPPARWLARGIVALAGLVCLGSLVAALAPPTAGDALCYHLELPKAFLAEHSLGYLRYHENSTFPLLVEMWYLWALALDGPVAAGLVHWELGILMALATVVLATPILGRPWARLAGAVVLLTPGVGNQMTAPLNDLGLAAMTTLALAAWWQAAVNDESRRWFVLAGLMAGGALATKYLALIYAAAVLIPWGWMLLHRPQQRRALVEGAAIAGVVAISVAGLWYVRAAWHRGNPVYPFLSELQSSHASTGQAYQTLPQSKSPLGRSPLALIVAPWHVTMHPERFGGRGHQLGVLWLAVLPGLLLTRRLRGMRTLLAVAMIYVLLWFLLRQNVRFLFPIVPLASVAVVWVWIEVRRMPRFAELVIAAAVAAILAASAVVGLARCRQEVAVACGLEGREDYLAAHEPTWIAADISNRLLGTAGHLLSQDYRAFYFHCPVTRESVYRQKDRPSYDRRFADPRQFSQTLRDAGFSHILLVENASGGGDIDPTLSRLADAQSAAGGGSGLLQLAEYRFRDDDGAVRRYRLMLLR